MIDPELYAFAMRNRLDPEATRALSELVQRIRDRALRGTLDSLVSEGEPAEDTQAPGTLGTLPTPSSSSGGPRRAPALVGTMSRGVRYQDIKQIGTGGMGEVRRVRDVDLDRTVAMKIIRGEQRQVGASLKDFVEEAKITARLQHPAIVPVHELGQLEDGRFYFTMKEIQGRTLKRVIESVHDSSTSGRWGLSREGFSLRRLVDALQQVCAAVAYAHSKLVVHRDLKPSNVMVGEYGEVVLMDWGLARELRPGVPPVEGVVGTAPYMPPEQAAGKAVDFRSDVYSLGTILYYILTGWAPYRDGTPQELIRKVLDGPPAPPVQNGHSTGPSNLPLPPELVAICSRAMMRDPGARYRDAGELRRAIGDWLDGARLREQALALLRDADARRPAAVMLRATTLKLRDEANSTLEDLGPGAAVELKVPAWEKLDRAEALELDAERKEQEILQTVRSALSLVPDLPEAHERLADHYRALHERAEAERDAAMAARAETQLRFHDRAGRHRGYLSGSGTLSLCSEPDGAEVLLYRYKPHHRRLVPVFARHLGRTPLVDLSLDMGSWFLLVRAPGHAELRYPVQVGRQDHHNAQPPRATAPRPVRLPRDGALTAVSCFVPAGWFWAGGDDGAADALRRRRLWCEDVMVRRFPVTNREYLRFLDALSHEGKDELARRYVPRQPTGADLSRGDPLFEQGYGGGWEIRAAGKGGLCEPDGAVVLIDRASAMAYADWYARESGKPWRLPSELEWEKAARGVDGRLFPWGNWLDPNWCNMATSHPRGPRPMLVGARPTDDSPYLVRDLGGNVREWCLETWRKEGPSCPAEMVVVPQPHDDPLGLYAVRGGSWLSGAQRCRSASREGVLGATRAADLGFRLVRSPTPDELLQG